MRLRVSGPSAVGRGAVLLLGAAACAGCATGAPSKAKLDGRAALAEYVDRAGSYGFSGAVLATRGDRIILKQASGFADISAGRRNTPQTLFDLGSLAKQFTATAILKLEEEGRVATTDRVARFFPDLPAAVANLTLHQHLTHSSGLPWDIGSPGEPLTKEAFFARLGRVQLESEPGGRYAYSNAGYSLLAAIVEKVSGMEFDRFLQQRLFAPAGMRATGYFTAPLPDHPAARGYLANEDRGYPWEAPDNMDGRPSWTSMGAGSVISTVEDMDRWAAALLTGRIIRPASLARLFACQIETGPGECYGYGWNVETARGRRLIWHDGSNGSFWARLSIYPEEGLRLAIMSNKAIQYGWIADERLRGTLLGGPAPALPPRAAPLTADEVTRLAGRYEFGSAQVGIEKVGDDLFVEPRNGDALALLMPSESTDERAASLTAAAEPVLRAASAGDFEPLRALAPSETAYQAMRDNLTYLRSRGPQLGGFEGFGLIGTAIGPTGIPGSLATYGYASFGAGRAPLRLTWERDRLGEVMIQTAAFVNPPRFAVQRLPGGGLVAYSLALQRSIRLTTDPVGAVTLIVDGRSYVGRKEPAGQR